MDLYLAGDVRYNGVKWNRTDVALLESFYYITPEAERVIPHLDKFLLDSGAYTFFSAGKHIDWAEYVDKYIDFINRLDIKLFFELDIDALIGYDKVIEIRRYIEQKTGKQVIPVWHTSRGKDNFLRMCDEYPYVAIGGIAGKDKGAKEYKELHKCFPWFINEAHKRGTKIHGLGFTSLQGLPKYHFDSVDSTAWTTGNRFGYVYKFDGKTMTKMDVPKGKRLVTKAVAQHNFDEWAKFQKYAKAHF